MYASLREQNNGMEGKGFKNPPIPDAGGQRRVHLPHMDMPEVNRDIFQHAIFHRGKGTLRSTCHNMAFRKHDIESQGISGAQGGDGERNNMTLRLPRVARACIKNADMSQNTTNIR